MEMAAVPIRCMLLVKLPWRGRSFPSSPRLEVSQSLFFSYGKTKKLSVLARERPLLDMLDTGCEPM